MLLLLLLLPCFFFLWLLLLLGPSPSHNNDDGDDDDCQRCVVDKLRCVSFLEACQVRTLPTRTATTATAKHCCTNNLREDWVLFVSVVVDGGGVGVGVVVSVMMDSKIKRIGSRNCGLFVDVLDGEARLDGSKKEEIGNVSFV